MRLKRLASNLAWVENLHKTHERLCGIRKACWFSFKDWYGYPEFRSFFIAITILTLTPGLDTALVIRNTSRAGFADGCTTSLGICFGLFVHATFSAIGISAILAQSAELFQIVKMVGAAYLIWLGISGLRSLMKTGQGIEVASLAHAQFRLTRSLREGFLSNVLNPKTAVFT